MDSTTVNENIGMESKLLQENDIISGKTKIIYIKPVEGETGGSHDISDCVQTLDDKTEEDLAQEQEHEKADYISIISETQEHETTGAENIENTSRNLENLGHSDHKSPANQGTVNGEEHDLTEENDDRFASKIEEYPDNISESQQYEISDEENIEDTTSNSNNSKYSGWESPATQGTANEESQSLTEENNKSNRDALKIQSSSFSPRKESLNVPDYTLLKDVRRESAVSNARDGSKLSLLSPIPRRSMQMKTDFTAIQMPVEEKSMVPLQEDSWIRIAIPYLPLWLAVLCLVLNILISGSGTILSGFCYLCCAKPRVPPKYDPDPVLLICANTWVGLAQLFTVTFLLVGWFWSIAWGIRMVVLSLERRRELRLKLQREAVSAFGDALARKIY